MQFTEEQELLRESIRKFVAKELPPGFARQCDREQRPPMEQYKRLAEAGYLSLGVPEEYGGAGGGIVELTILLEELARGMMSFSIMVYRSAVHGAQSLLTYGNAEQRERLLPGIMSGELLFCLSLTEPEAGSDAASLKIKAVRDGDDFVITGQKMFNSSAHIANYILLAARTNWDVPQHKGISLFLVDTRTEGLTIQRVETMGERAIGTNAVFYDGVRVPAKNLMGTLDNGWTQLAINLEKERLCLAAWCTGAAESALEEAVEYAKDRKQFGHPIGSFQAIQHTIAGMAMDVHAGKLMLYDLAEKVQSKTPCRMEASMTKAYCTEMYSRVADRGLQVQGGYGYTMESNMQLHMRDARIMTIGGGSSEIMRNIIARELGLPKQ